MYVMCLVQTLSTLLCSKIYEFLGFLKYESKFIGKLLQVQ